MKIKLNLTQLGKIKHYACKAFPEEICGVLTEFDYIPLTNIAEDKLSNFVIHPVEYSEVKEQATAIVHTHCKKGAWNIATPSSEDVKYATKSGKPWLIFGCDGEGITTPAQYPYTYNSSLLRRPFIWYVNDCYTMLLDYYKQFFDIDIPFATDAYADDRYKIGELLADRYLQYGFTKVSTHDGYRKGDVLLSSRGGLINNHVAIYHENNTCYHQGELSEVIPFANIKDKVNLHLRYNSLC